MPTQAFFAVSDLSYSAKLLGFFFSFSAFPTIDISKIKIRFLLQDSVSP